MATLEQIGPDIWIAEGPVVDFYSFAYPTRMVIARLPDAGLWVWSPIALDPGLRDAVADLGTPTHLVSPNRLHHLFLADWARTWPEARIWALPSVAKKLRKLAITDWLDDDPPSEWAEAIDQTVFRGNPLLEEAVFFHKPSGTAIFTDLTENFSEDFLKTHWRGWKHWIARLWRITEPYGEAPLELRLTWFGRAEGRRALEKVRGWQPEKVVMAHGNWIRTGGTGFVEKSFHWLA